MNENNDFITDTIICELQNSAYRMKHSLENARAETEAARKALEQRVANEQACENQLREIADFLWKHNSAASDNWYAELGLPPAGESDEG